ncbi:hypothetical protein P9139_05840 [Curtobacterium flaccumfaciens]|nr:hypothetical protein P9139_05840 [Curtobacterium flaccumfaciens]
MSSDDDEIIVRSRIERSTIAESPLHVAGVPVPGPDEVKAVPRAVGQRRIEVAFPSLSQGH